jgi:two-component system response regulator DegU
MLEALRRILHAEPEFLLVGEAKNGEEAIERARELSPDVILMDLNMPRVNGLEATKRIKHTRPETKVIIVSVHSDPLYEIAAIENGADAFVPKKCLSTHLVPTIFKIAGKGSSPQNT